MAEVLRIDWNDPEVSTATTDRIQSLLLSGGVIGFPTDTFYGLGADPHNPDALAKIFKLKQRAPDKPLLVLIPSLKYLETLTFKVNDNARRLMERFWPGPLTLVFSAAPGVPEILTAGTGTIGIRFPAEDFVRRFLAALGQPLTAPSANISGEPEPRTAREVQAAFDAGLDIIVDGGPAPGGQLSTVLDTTTDPPTLIREGAVSRNDLESVLPIQIR